MKLLMANPCLQLSKISAGSVCGMPFKELWLSMPVAERRRFATRCGASYNYLNLFAFGQKPRIGEGIAIAIERESARRVTVEQLRPDIDWAVIRGCPAREEAA